MVEASALSSTAPEVTRDHGPADSPQPHEVSSVVILLTARTRARGLAAGVTQRRYRTHEMNPGEQGTKTHPVGGQFSDSRCVQTRF